MDKITKQIPLIAFVSLASSISIKAEPLLAQNSGFYLGGAVGGSDLSAKSNLLLRRLVIGAPASQTFSLKNTDKNIEGEVFGGFERRIGYLIVGGEIIGSISPLKSISTLGLTTINPQNLELKTTNALGGAFKLGYYFNATNKLYFKMGFEVRRFNVTFSDPSNALLNLNKSYTSTGFVPGLGLEVDLTPHISLRTEYRIALHTNKTAEIANVATSQITSAHIKPAIHYLNLGVVYKI